MSYIVSGIQQVGIGVDDVHEAWKWYRKVFGMDVRIFEDASVANLMLPYTGGKPRERHAVLAYNLQGGGGFEIWQHTGREPLHPTNILNLGDTGIHIAKIKSYDLDHTAKFLQKNDVIKDITIEVDPGGRRHMIIKDPYNNLFQIVEADSFFSKKRPFSNGGVYGVFIGSTNIDKSIYLYSEILGYNHVEYDISGYFTDLSSIEGSEGRFRRVLLKHPKPRKGAFSELLGDTEIELVQTLDREPIPIYFNRMWGDPGFIHLCFDISNMQALQVKCEEHGFPFTVDSSNSFDMGEAAGHFSYIEDPDGTLIEFVETHKIPILKKLGWYLNLKKRDREKSLPKWLIKALRFNRVK